LFCHQCGESISEKSRFCSHCGAKITDHDDTGSQRQFRAENEAEVQPKQSGIRRFLPALIPVFSLVIVAGGLAYTYFHEHDINEEVMSLKVKAEETALNGEFKNAQGLLVQAKSKRPEYTVLEQNLDGVSQAIQYEETLANISELIKKTEFEAALKEIASLKEKLNANQSPLFHPIQEEIKQKETSIKIGMIKLQLNDLTSVDQLAGKLSILSSFPEEEASAIKTEILNKIVSISVKEAEDELSNKQFSSASSTLDKGLQYAVNNEKLLALKERVQQEKDAFEKAEQQRLEQAMEAAAQEDLNNRTAAVDVTEFTAEVDEYGDLYFRGSIENIATTSISSITIHYRISDESGKTIDEGSTSVYPFELQPEETGTFEDVYYGVHQDVIVDIDNITWYLN
jgi:hypothetical protein